MLDTMPAMRHVHTAPAAVSSVRASLMAGFPPPLDLRVNVSNWQAPQNVRWAFRHMREFIPTQLISAGTEDPQPLPATGTTLGNPSGGAAGRKHVDSGGHPCQHVH